MLDIWTLLLLTPEDRYAPSPLWREVECLVFPLLRERQASANHARRESGLRPRPVPA